MSDGIFQVQLRRLDTSQQWGFRLKGGADQGIPLHVEQCNPKGRAAHAGLQPGDAIMSICGMPTNNMTHMQIKQEMLRAGNELDLVVNRGALTGAVNVEAAPEPQPQPTPKQPPTQMRSRPAPAQPQQNEPRAQVVEEPTAKIGGPMYKKVTPKTYQVLQDELPQSATGGPRPASIFDRNKGERSGYLQAKGKPTIQKAYGQTH